MVIDLRVNEVKKENVALKRKIKEMEEELNVERMSLAALKGFLVADYTQCKMTVEWKMKDKAWMEKES